MATIEQIIQQEVNPFDATNFYTRNFWEEQDDSGLTVNSIHQNVINEIETVLAQVSKDHKSRTLLLTGDSGSGKSYLLGTLKRLLNPKAFFAYIGPWPQSDYIWRHVLRQTVDSLMYVPEGQKESQLLLWLKSLSAFTKPNLKQRIFDVPFWESLLSNRQNFIKHLKTTYKNAGIYNAEMFFGALYALSDPELYTLACEWLRGDDLSEESLQALKLKKSIETEQDACGILSNLGRISSEIKPIVLCFDQLDNIPQLPDGHIDLQALFNVNSTLHTYGTNNFLIIISIITSTWRVNESRIPSADKVRINAGAISLKPISLDEAQAIWEKRLYPLHKKADTQPTSSIYPLTRKDLDDKFPRRKTTPRYALKLGRQLIQTYKAKSVNIETSKEPDILASFKLVWLKEFKRSEEKIKNIALFSSPELIRMLKEVLEALQTSEIQTDFFKNSTYNSYSLSYKPSNAAEKIGVVWTENPNKNSLFHIMNACEKAVSQNLCKTLYLIRAESLGNSNNKGYKRYAQIFVGSSHVHIIPDLVFVYYLATYHSLVNAACSGDLVVGDKTPNLSELQSLVRDSKIFEECSLLQKLGIIEGDNNAILKPQLLPVKSFVLSLVKTQQLIGFNLVIQNALSQFPQVSKTAVEQIIQQLCQEKEIQFLNPTAPVDAQLLCLVVQNSQ